MLVICQKCKKEYPVNINIIPNDNRFIPCKNCQHNIFLPSPGIITTTAHTLEGFSIDRHIEIISAECAFGMNIFKDFFASLSDFFGGRNESTQKVLKDARKTCISELKKEAISLEADAIIGVDLDYSEISSQGKSMLFLVSTGTAVNLKYIA